MKVRYTPQARSDLASYARYLKAKSPKGATRVRDSILAAVETIGQFPETGRRLGGGDIRKFVAPPYAYVIYYRIDAGEQRIDILTIQHPAARPDFGDEGG